VKIGVFAKIGVCREKYLEIGAYAKNGFFAKISVFCENRRFTKIGVFRKNRRFLQKNT
jgi:hypothetical protein